MQDRDGRESRREENIEDDALKVRTPAHQKRFTERGLQLPEILVTEAPLPQLGGDSLQRHVHSLPAKHLGGDADMIELLIMCFCVTVGVLFSTVLCIV